MTLKRCIILAAAVLATTFTACQKDPSSSDIDDDYAVYTNHDTAYDFRQPSTFFLPDSILLIGRRDKAEYWKDDDARQIVGALARSMTESGYVRTDDKSAADVGLQLSYVERVTYFIGCDSPYWWWDYPFYWGPDYWGDWYGWYCPYAVSYRYASGSLLTEMLDLTKRPTADDEELAVVWGSFIGGLLSADRRVNLQRTLEGIGQSFEQSPYLRKTDL